MVDCVSEEVAKVVELRDSALEVDWTASARIETVDYIC